MTFAYPFMFWGSFAIAVPVIIHLLNRQRYQHVKWAAMRFVRVATEQNRRRIRIEDILLLLLRCALLAALLFAAVRPMWKRFANLVPTGGVTAVVILDNSSGMTGGDGVTTRFKTAQAAADAFVAKLPTGSAAAVFLASDRVDPLVPEPTRDLTFVRRAIQQEKGPSDFPPKLETAVARAIALLKKSPGNKALYIITDGRSGGWSPVDPVTKLLADAHDDIPAQVVLVGPAVTQNVGVVSISTGGDLVPIGRPTRFDVTVTNFGSTDAPKQMPVRLTIDGEQSAESETTIDSLPAGKSAVVALHGTLATAGPHWVTASIPADRMPADDSRTITVTGIESVRVLLVDGTPHHPGTQTGGDFVQTALASFQPDRTKKAFVQVTTVHPTDVTRARLDQTDVVIAVDANLPPAAAKSIDQFVRGGGGLLYFPGPAADVGAVNADLVDRLHLLPSPYQPLTADSADLTFHGPRFDHPITSIWNDPANGNLETIHIARHLPMKSPDPADAGPTAVKASDVVLSYSDNTPAILQRAAGLGTVIQFGTSADTSWTELPLKSNFLPLLYRSVASVMALRDAGANVTVGHAFVRTVPIELAGRPVTVVDPSGTKSQTTVVMADDKAVVTVPNIDRAGRYTLSIAGAEPPAAPGAAPAKANKSEPPPAFTTRFAAQSDPAGSRLDLLSGDQSNVLSSAAVIKTWDASGSVFEADSGQGAGELWFIFGVAALVLTIVEPLAANWMSRSK